MALILVFFLLAEHHWKCILKEPIISHSYGVIPMNSFQMCLALKDMVGKLMSMAHFFQNQNEIVPQELIDILCNNSTVCEEEKDYYDDDDATEADRLMDVVYEEDSDDD